MIVLPVESLGQLTGVLAGPHGLGPVQSGLIAAATAAVVVHSFPADRWSRHGTADRREKVADSRGPTGCLVDIHVAVTATISCRAAEVGPPLGSEVAAGVGKVV